MLDPVKQTLEAFASVNEFGYFRGAWYRESPETVTLLALQRSNYGAEYFFVIACDLLEAAGSRRERYWKIDIQIRLGSVPGVDPSEVSQLLSLDNAISAADRERRLASLLDSALPFIDSLATAADVRRAWDDGALRRAAVTKAAREAFGLG